jgi:hypothetical protein
VADVVNETGEPVFDLALKSALETDLRQSPYVNVLAPEQVQDTLRLMRLGPEPLDGPGGRVPEGGRPSARAGPRAGEAYEVAPPRRAATGR